MPTEEDVGYQDAMRQLHRNLARRVKVLEDELKDAEPDKRDRITARLEEVHHLMQVIDSLHR